MKQINNSTNIIKTISNNLKSYNILTNNHENQNVNNHSNQNISK